MAEPSLVPIQMRKSEDGKTLTVWTTIEKPALTVEQIRLLILALAVQRAEMLPPVPSEPPPPDQLPFLDSPTTYLMHDPSADGGILLVRDPGWGWRGHQFSRETLDRVRTRIDEILGQGAAAARH